MICGHTLVEVGPAGLMNAFVIKFSFTKSDVH